MEREKHRDRRENGNRQQIIKGVIIGAVILVVLVAGYVACKMIYAAGRDAGVAQEKNDRNEELTVLGAVIEEKTKTILAISELNGKVPVEANAENISGYISTLGEVISGVKNEEVKKTLEGYKAEWEKFLETYNSEDNSAIEEALNNLRSAASDAGMKITDIYNSAITEAAKKLPE